MKIKTIIKRVLCVLMITLTLVTSAPLAGFVGLDVENPFSATAEAASVVKSWSVKAVEKLLTVFAHKEPHIKICTCVAYRVILCILFKVVLVCAEIKACLCAFNLLCKVDSRFNLSVIVRKLFHSFYRP